MSFKAIIFCASALFIQTIVGQTICYRPSSSSSCGCQSISIPSSGGDFLITAVGPIAPAGIAVATDLGLSGELDLSGQLPYLSAVAFEGTFPTSGSAPVSYGCGDCVAITQQIGGSGSLPSFSASGCGCGR